MASHTSTATTWGSMDVFYEDDELRMVSKCKACDRVTTQHIALGDSPFEAVRPQHAHGCRFHPDTPKPEPVTYAASAAPAMTLPPVAAPISALRAPVSRLDLAIGTGIGLGSLLLGHWLW